MRGGLAWQMLPPRVPPISTVQGWLLALVGQPAVVSLNHALLLIEQEATRCDASPSAGGIDS